MASSLCLVLLDARAFLEYPCVHCFSKATYRLQKRTMDLGGWCWFLTKNHALILTKVVIWPEVCFGSGVNVAWLLQLRFQPYHLLHLQHRVSERVPADPDGQVLRLRDRFDASRERQPGQEEGSRQGDGRNGAERDDGAPAERLGDAPPRLRSQPTLVGGFAETYPGQFVRTPRWRGGVRHLSSGTLSLVSVFLPKTK